MTEYVTIQASSSFVLRLISSFAAVRYNQVLVGHTTGIHLIVYAWLPCVYTHALFWGACPGPSLFTGHCTPINCSREKETWMRKSVYRTNQSSSISMQTCFDTQKPYIDCLVSVVFQRREKELVGKRRSILSIVQQVYFNRLLLLYRCSNPVYILLRRVGSLKKSTVSSFNFGKRESSQLAESVRRKDDG